MGEAATASPILADLGDGRPVLALGEGFAGSAAHRALAKRFRVIAMAVGLTPEAVAAWAAEGGLEGVGVIGFGASAAAAMATAAALGERAQALVLVSPQGLLDAAPEIPVATAVLIGSRDASQPKDAVARYRRALPRCHVVVVYDAGANLATDRPDTFADVAGDFLDRQGRFNLFTESMALTRG